MKRESSRSSESSIETSPNQVLRRTTANEPLMIIQQLQRQRGFEAWHLIVRRFDQRNMSDKNSAYAALISNISERDRAKDVEHLDDILRTCINDVNKFENRIGKMRDEGETLAVKKLMLDSLLNCKFHGTTLSYEELIIAIENIIVDKVTTITSRQRKNDTSAPMEIGMAAKDDSDGSREDGTEKGSWNAGKGMSFKGKGGQDSGRTVEG